MTKKTKIITIYFAIATMTWIYYCNTGISQHKTKAYNFGQAIVWPLSIWSHK